jgi:hypothetical protein
VPFKSQGGQQLLHHSQHFSFVNGAIGAFVRHTSMVLYVFSSDSLRIVIVENHRIKHRNIECEAQYEELICRIDL